MSFGQMLAGGGGLKATLPTVAEKTPATGNATGGGFLAMLQKQIQK